MSESLANGAKTEFLLSAGDSITITGNCEVTTQYAGTSRLQKNPSTVGPFQVDARVLIAATASVTYTIIDMEPGNQFSTAEEASLRALAAVETPLVSLAAVEDSVVSLVSGGGIPALAKKLAAFRPNPADRQGYCLAPPAWSARVYTKGEAVVGGDGRVKIVLGTFTSSASPSTISTLPVADPGDETTGPANSKGWIDWGAVNTVPSDVVSYAAQAGAPSLSDVGGTYAYLTAREVSDPASLPFFNGSGAAIPYSGVYTAANLRTANGGGWSFMTDEPVIGWRDPSGDHPVYVDGVRVNVGLLGSAAAAYKVLTFSGRRMRRIRIEWGSAAPTNFYLGTNALLLADLKSAAFSWLALGDSYFAGAGPGPAYAFGVWPKCIADELGLPPPVQCAVGGTGWLTLNGASYNYLQRLQADQTAHTAKSYDLIVAQGSGNDVGNDSALMAAQYAATLALLRTIAPQAPIFVTGIANGDLTTVGATATLNAVLSAAVATFAAADRNTFFIPLSADITNGVPLLNPNNAANYVGPTDRHMFDSGHLYAGRYVANQIRGLAKV